MQLKRIKPYKANLPGETIESIKSTFRELGFLSVEKTVETNTLFKAYSVSLVNPGNNKVIFSTHGKGTNAAWALASAWGEMIERFQNLAFFMICIYSSQPELGNQKATGFKYYPDEKVFIDEYNVFQRKKHQFIGVPFLNILNDETAHFPFRALQVIVGSNGMCSGNTKEEALIQGISEIFERYILKELYTSPFCPPDIPLDYFDGSEIHGKIKELIRSSNYRVQIKDCSLGKGYPVIGVLVLNEYNGYAYHLGADPSPITALERCLTEMHQGGKICFQSLDELRRTPHCDLQSDFWKSNFSHTISAYAGHWPHEIFQDNPDYEFSGFKHPVSISDEEDLAYLLDTLKAENREIYIRDNSFLGHPSFYIYIPGMSEMTSCPDSSFSDIYLEFDSFLPILTNLNTSKENDRAGLLRIIKAYATLSPGNEFRAIDYFFFFKEHPLAQLAYPQFESVLTESLLEKNKDISKNMNIPSCFNCQNCSSSEMCNFSFITESWKQVQAKMKSFYRNTETNLSAL